MAFDCPDGHKGKLSARDVTIKKCLECGKIVGTRELFDLLRELGVSEETIRKIKSDLAVDQL